MSRLVSFIILAAIVLFMSGMFFWVMAQFVLPIFLALVLVVMLRPLHRWLTATCGGRVRLAALLTTLAALLTVMVPAALLVTRAASEGMSVAGALSRRDLADRMAVIRQRLHLALPSHAVRLRCDAIAARVAALRDAPPGDDDEPGPRGAENISGAVVGAAPRAEPADEASNSGSDAQTIARPLEAKPGQPPLSRRQLAAELSEQVASLRQQLSRELPVAEEPGPAAWQQERQREAIQVGKALDRLSAAVAELDAAAAAKGAPPKGQSADDAGGDPSGTSGGDSAWQAAAEQVVEAQEAFRDALLGDPFWYWVKLQANPEDDEVRLESLREGIQSFAGPLALSTTQAVAGFLGKFIVGLCILLVSLYYFLADGAAMVDGIMRLSPLDRRFAEQMLTEFDKVSRAVVLATLLSAVVQGILAGIGFFVAGIGAVFLLSLLTMVLAMVPFVGAAAVWGGCSLWLLLYEERTMAAALLALYGAGIVSTSDNVIKPLVLHGQSNIHPLLALLSVLGGVTTLGPIGIFVGPMVVAFLHALLTMLQAELSALSGEPPPRLPPPKRRFRLR